MEEEYFLNSNDLALYFHIPFCKSKCLYCDYPSTTNISMQKEYFNCLKKEILLRKNFLLKNSIKTVYFGGGTPNYVKSFYIKEVMDFLKDNFFGTFEEITMEMNPGILNEKDLEVYKSAGINRISLGVQSVDKNILKLVNRPYYPETISDNIYLLRNFFDNISFDFIMGLPEDNLNVVKSNLNFIKLHRPEHISYYVYDSDHDSLLEKMKQKFLMPEDDFFDEGLDFIYSKLNEFDYKRYEISSWAIFDKESYHNKFYWRNLNYIGFGISAGGYYNRNRYVNEKNISRYMNKLNSEELPEEYSVKNSFFDDFKETLFMGLRLFEGIDLRELKKRYECIDVDKYIDYLIGNFSAFFDKNEKLKLNENGFNHSRYVFLKIVEMEE